MSVFMKRNKTHHFDEDWDVTDGQATITDIHQDADESVSPGSAKEPISWQNMRKRQSVVRYSSKSIGINADHLTQEGPLRQLLVRPSINITTNSDIQDYIINGPRRAKNSEWVWSGNTTITNRSQIRDTARKSHRLIRRHREDKLSKAIWPRGYKTWVNSQTQNKAQWLAACGHVSASNQSLRFILSLRMNSSFITSRPALSSTKMIAKLEWTQSNAKQNIERYATTKKLLMSTRCTYWEVRLMFTRISTIYSNVFILDLYHYIGECEA